jgi:Glyoxalase-like domain
MNDGKPQQQLHLDLWVDYLKAAHEQAILLGARLLKPARDPEAAVQHPHPWVGGRPPLNDVEWWTLTLSQITATGGAAG